MRVIVDGGVSGRGRGSGRLRRGRVLGVVVVGVVAAAVAVAVVLASRGGESDAKPLGRGAPAALASSAAAVPPALDPAAALASVNATREAIAVGALAPSPCLDAAAAATAAGFADGAVPDRLAAAPGCEAGAGPSSVRWGWVSGSDPTGAAQLLAAFARGASGPPGLVAADARYVGLSLDRQSDSAGRMTGFVLVWAVSA